MSNQFKKPDSVKNNSSNHHSATNNGLSSGKKPPVLEKSKLSNSASSKIASFQEKFSKESPPVTPSALTSNNSHSYSLHNNNNNGTSTNGSYNSHSTMASSTIPNSSNQLTDLMEELKLCKSILIKHEARIRELEKKLVDQNKGTNSFYSKSALKSQYNENSFLPDEV